VNNVPLKRALAAVGIAAVLGGAAIGVAGAQTATPSPSATRTPTAGQQQAEQRYQQFLDTLASKLGVTSDKLKQAIADTRQSLGLPANGPGFGPGFGRGGPGGPGRRGPGVSFDVAAKTIGISADQLRQELAGKSLSDVAKAHNVDPAKVSDALKADEATRIDQAVQNGRLTADQATQAKQQANTRIDQLMTQQLPAGGPGGTNGRRPRGSFGRPGGPNAQGTPRASVTPGAQRSSYYAPTGPDGRGQI
jgi:hypothetical protein